MYLKYRYLNQTLLNKTTDSEIVNDFSFPIHTIKGTDIRTIHATDKRTKRHSLLQKISRFHPNTQPINNGYIWI